MVKQPYFMSKKEWFTKNENGEYILTEFATKEAVDDYNQRREEYQQALKGMTDEEYIDFITSEDSWLTFPV